MKPSDINAANEMYVDSTVDAAEGMEKLANELKDNVKAVQIDTKQTKALTGKKKDLTWNIVDNNDAVSKDSKATEELTEAKEKFTEAIKNKTDDLGDFGTATGESNKAQQDFAKFMKESVSAMKAEMKETRQQVKEDRAERKAESDERKRKTKLDKEEYQAKSETLKEEKEASKVERERLKLEKERLKAQREKDKIESQLNKQQNMIDYSKRLNKANKRLAEMMDREYRKREQLLDDIEREDDKEEHYRKIKDKYRRRATKEYEEKNPVRKGLFKKIEKYSKTSESATGRMASKMFLGGAGMISDKIDKFTDVPIIKQGKGAYRFVRDNVRGAKKSRKDRKIRERAQQMRKEDLANMKDTGRFENAFVSGKDETAAAIEKSANKVLRSSRDKKIHEEIVKTNEILTKIYDHLIFKSMMGMAGSLMSGTAGIAGAVSKGVASAFAGAGIGKLLQSISKRLPSLPGTKSKVPGLPGPDVKGPKSTTKSPSGPDGPKGVNKGYTYEGEFERVTPKKELPGKTPTKMQKVQKGVAKVFSKVLSGRGAARALLGMGLRFAGPIGAAYTVYEVASALGLTDKAEEYVKNVWNDMTSDSPSPTQVAMSGDTKTQMNKYNSSLTRMTTYGSSATAGVGDTYVQAEKLEAAKTVAEARAQIEKEARIANANSTSNGMNVISTTNSNVNNHNNYGSSFHFNNSMYQSFGDRGVHFQR